jgi:hypothetical protein
MIHFPPRQELNWNNGHSLPLNCMTLQAKHCKYATATGSSNETQCLLYYFSFLLFCYLLFYSLLLFSLLLFYGGFMASSLFIWTRTRPASHKLILIFQLQNNCSLPNFNGLSVINVAKSTKFCISECKNFLHISNLFLYSLVQNLVDLARLVTLRLLKLGDEQLFWSWKIKINLWEAGRVLVQITIPKFPLKFYRKQVTCVYCLLLPVRFTILTLKIDIHYTLYRCWQVKISGHILVL